MLLLLMLKIMEGSGLMVQERSGHFFQYHHYHRPQNAYAHFFSFSLELRLLMNLVPLGSGAFRLAVVVYSMLHEGIN